MHSRAYELVKSFLKRDDEKELPPIVKRALIGNLHGTQEARDLLRELAEISLERATHILEIMEANKVPYDLDILRQEILLIEKEVSLAEEANEAKALAARDNGAALEASLTIFSLLSAEKRESMERRYRILALALEVNDPRRAAEFIRDIGPEEEPGFWQSIRLRLMQQVKDESPQHAIPLIDSPRYVFQWLLDSDLALGVEAEIIPLLITRVRELGIPNASLEETLQLIHILERRDFAQRSDLLCLLANSCWHPKVLTRLMDVGKNLPESERTRLAEVIQFAGIGSLPEKDRREVLRRLAHFTRHCHPQMRREIHVLRAIALLEHLSISRLVRAFEWRHAYDSDSRFLTRLKFVSQDWKLIT